MPDKLQTDRFERFQVIAQSINTMSKLDNHTYRLIIHCPDKVGIVAAVSQFIADHNGWLLESNYHADPDSD